MTPKRTVSELVIELREKAGLSQQELADRGGKDRSHFANVEIGQNKGSGSVFRQALARALGVSLDVISLYLDDQTMTAEEVLAAADRTRAPTAVADDDDPFPERAQAVSILRGARMPESVISALQHRNMKSSDQNLTVEEWCEEGQRLLALQLRHADRIAHTQAHGPSDPEPIAAADKAKAIAKRRRR